VHSPVGRVLLIVSGVLLVGWLSWLGYTALTKSRAPIVSRAQAAAATVPVRALLTTGVQDQPSYHVHMERAGKVTTVFKAQADRPALVVEVVEKLHPDGPEPGTKIGVRNLPECGGYTGPGEYLLLLVKDDDATLDDHPAYKLIGQQRSPGSELADVGQPMIYPWTDKTGDDLRQQVKRLFP
jgi:hypothetical protein